MQVKPYDIVISWIRIINHKVIFNSNRIHSRPIIFKMPNNFIQIDQMITTDSNDLFTAAYINPIAVKLEAQSTLRGF